jgi:hypothetical protein
VCASPVSPISDLCVTRVAPIDARQAEGQDVSLMLAWVRGLFDRLLLVTAAVGGGLVPGFISQYRQRLGGRLDQARLDLQAWQRIADQFFHGDLQRLIQYHLHSSDATVRAEGGIIEGLLVTVQRLQSAMEALRGNLYHQFAYLVVHPDPALVHATLSDWVPTFALSLDGLSFAALFALLVWLVFHAAWQLLAWVGGRPRRAQLRSRQQRKEPSITADRR